ncbi:MAG: SDR family oxidoreductase [Gammaproteobacteria bacterium]|nr:SDR family oxidoreductase [Gammaproteobacteria bacterium]
MEDALKGRVAIVTGASGGIGSVIARELAIHGADVAVCFGGEKRNADAVVKEISSLGRLAAAFELDQRDPTSVVSVIREVLGQFGRIDILINNAAWNVGIPFSDLESMTPDLWDRLLETNLRGPFLMARAAAAELKRSGAGHVVNISSNGGIAPSSSSIGYSTSKAGLIHLTRCLAVSMAPEVAVNCIAPGVVSGTRMSARMPSEVLMSETAASVLGRTATAEDVARQVIAFCTSSSVSGQTVAIDGGMPVAMR